MNKIVAKIDVSYKEIIKSQPCTYGEINMSNDNDINIPSISPSMSSEPETREPINVLGGEVTNNMLDLSPFTLDTYTFKESFPSNMIVNNDPLSMNTSFNDNNNKQFVAPINI